MRLDIARGLGTRLDIARGLGTRLDIARGLGMRLDILVWRCRPFRIQWKGSGLLSIYDLCPFSKIGRPNQISRKSN